MRDHLESKLTEQIQRGVPLTEKSLLNMVEKGHLSPEAMDRILSKRQQSTNETRKNVVTLRVTDEINQTLEDLVSLSIAQSRSEAAYMLIIEGIKARTDLFDEIKKHSEEIEKIKKEIQQTTSDFGQL